jgi:hypothetical protein
MNEGFWSWAFSVVGTAAVIVAPLLIPAVRDLVAKYLTSLVQHDFDSRIEMLKSELRRAEERVAAELRSAERQIQSVADSALTQRSSRQAVLDARRLEAVEKLWKAKTATDRLRMAAGMVSVLKLEEVFKAAEKGDTKIQALAQTLDEASVGELNGPAEEMSATSERPFLPPDVWALFSAYQNVLLHSAVVLKSLAAGTTQFLRKEDTLKPLMLVALPEYKDFIEEFGLAGYCHLLDALEQKLLNALTEFLDGKALDDATLKRNAEIMAAIRTANATEPEVPADLRGVEVPDPPPTQQ